MSTIINAYPSADFYEIGTDSSIVTGVSLPLKLKNTILQVVNDAGNTVTSVSTDPTMANSSDVTLASSKATKDYVDNHPSNLGTASPPLYIVASNIELHNSDTHTVTSISTDGTMASNSDTILPSQKAVVSYVAAHSSFDPTAVLSISNTTESTSSSTGSINTAGGLGVQKKLRVGTDIYAGGDVLATNGVGTFKWVTANSTDDSTSPASGALWTGGGLGVTKHISAGAAISVTDATAAVNSAFDIPFVGLKATMGTNERNVIQLGSAASINNCGHVGFLYTGTPGDVNNRMFLGLQGTNDVLSAYTSKVVAEPTTESTTTSTGAFVTNGGVGIAKNLNVGGTASITNTTAQLKLAYDATHSTSFAVDASGNLTINSTGNVTSFDATDQVKVLNTTNSTTGSTGALILKGGIGATITGGSAITVDATTGGALQITGSDTWNTTAFTVQNTSTGSTKAYQMFITGSTNTAGASKLVMYDTITGSTYNTIWDSPNKSFKQYYDTDSTSTTTGGAVFYGGVGIAKSVYLGGDIIKTVPKLENANCDIITQSSIIGYDTIYASYGLRDDNSDYIVGQVDLPHSFCRTNATSTYNVIIPQIHFSLSNATAGNIEFLCQFKVSGVAGAEIWTTTNEDSFIFAAPGDGTYVKLFTQLFQTFDFTNYMDPAVLMIRVRRIATVGNANDTYAGNVYVTGISVHGYVDRMGR